MNNAIWIVIPGAPTGKGRPRVATRGGHARAYTPAKTRTREGIVASLAMDAMAGRPAMTGPVQVAVSVVSPIPTSWSRRKRAEAIDQPCPVKPDLDNIIKLVLDSINGIVFADDRQVVELIASKRYGEEPQIIVTVREV